MIGLSVKPVKEPEFAPIEKDTNYPKVFDEGAFTVDKGVHGFQSFDKEGAKMIYSFGEDLCVYWSRQWLMAQQEGWPESMGGRVVNDGKVGGKL